MANVSKIPLTQGQFAVVDNSDFEWLNKRKWYAHFNPRTKIFTARTSGFRDMGRQSIRVAMHRMIMNVHDPKIMVDHIDRDTLNNCRSNLRIATDSQSNANRKSQRDSTSKYLGVYWNKKGKKWHSQICKDGKHFHVGFFGNEEEAAKAYDTKALELHGEFANLNFKQIP